MKASNKVWMAVVLLVVVSAASTSWARTSSARGLTLLVLPERHNLIQTSFGIVEQRAAVVVSYRVSRATGETVLHAWSGQEWVRVPMDLYKEGQFLTVQPARILLVGDEDLVPADLLRASDWGPPLLMTTALDTAGYLNEVGTLLSFTSAEWRWFARRYKMELEDDTADIKDRGSWYDQMTRARQRQAPPRFERDVPPAEIRQIREDESHEREQPEKVKESVIEPAPRVERPTPQRSPDAVPVREAITPSRPELAPLEYQREEPSTIK